MKKQIVCLSLSVLLFALAACEPAIQTNSTETSAKETTTFSEFTEKYLSATDDISKNENVTGETATESNNTETDSGINAPIGSSIEQIVAFYNQYTDAVKSAGNVTIQKHNKRDGTMDIPSLLKAFMPNDMSGTDANQDETVTETFVNGTGINDTSRSLNDFLPVNGKAYLSRLNASAVKSASCEKQSDGWIVRIILKDEPFNMSEIQMNADMDEAEMERMMDEMISKSAYMSCMDIGFGGGDFTGGNGFDGESTQQMPINFDFSSMSMEAMYQNGAISAVFNKEGRLTSLSLSYENNMNTSILGMKISMNNISKQEYQFTW